MEYKAVISKDIFTKEDRKIIDECMKNQPFTFDDIRAFLRTDAWWYCVIVYFCSSVSECDLNGFIIDMNDDGFTYRSLVLAGRNNKHILINTDSFVDVNNVVANLIREFPDTKLYISTDDKNRDFTVATWAVFVKQNIRYIFDVPNKLQIHPVILNAVRENADVISQDILSTKLPRQILDIFHEKLTSRMSIRERMDFIKKINADPEQKINGKISLCEYCDLIKSHEIFTFKPLKPRYPCDSARIIKTFEDDEMYLIDELNYLIDTYQICDEVLLYLLLKHPYNFPLCGNTIARLDRLHEICFDIERFRASLIIVFNMTQYDDLTSGRLEKWYYERFGCSIWCERVPNYVCDTTFFKTDPRQQRDAQICQAAIARDISNLPFVKCRSDHLINNVIEHYPDKICDLQQPLNAAQLKELIAKDKLTPEVIDKHRTKVYKINPELVKNMTDDDWLSVISDNSANIPKLRERDPSCYKRLLPRMRTPFEYLENHHDFGDVDIKKELLAINPTFACDMPWCLEKYIKYIGAWERSLVYSPMTQIRWLQINIDYIFFDGEPKSVAESFASNME